MSKRMFGSKSENINNKEIHPLHQKIRLQKSDWLRGVQYWPYLYSVFNTCTL